jgi:hypothetical protein
MGLYGGTKVTYNPPPPDNTFSKYLEYQQAREKTLDAVLNKKEQRLKLKKLHVKHLEQQDMPD